jgi:hypothetical protein
MGVTHFVLVGTLTVAGSQGLSPKSESPQSQAPGAAFSPQGKNPYARIFPAPPQDPSSRPRFVPLPEKPTLNQDTQPRVVCGMVVVRVRPDADARMVIRTSNDPVPEYKIRKIAPQVCNK